MNRPTLLFSLLAIGSYMFGAAQVSNGNSDAWMMDTFFATIFVIVAVLCNQPRKYDE